MAGRDPAAGLFFEDQGLGINDNAQGYRYLIEAVNSELAPLVYALGASDYGDLAPSKKLANYRGVADAFAAVAQQRVKYVEDFSDTDHRPFGRNDSSSIRPKMTGILIVHNHSQGVDNDAFCR